MSSLGRTTDAEHLACEATLVRELATRHGLSSDQVRASRMDGSPLRLAAQWR